MFKLAGYAALLGACASGVLGANVTIGTTCIVPTDAIPNTSLINDILDSNTLVSEMSQDLTNGPNTFLGTLSAPPLPKFLGASNSSSNSSSALPPWGTATVSNADPELPPVTGVTRNYNFTISRGVLSPDGVNRSMILVNGQFPGPLIEANWGDMISVTVTNNIQDAVQDGVKVDAEGTAMHWHGLLQKGTGYMDGVPTVSQCPIAPGFSYTYTFRADSYGTSWYHSHYSAQYAGGAFGPMIIYGPSSADYDIDLGPVMLSDWYHDDYYTLVEQGSDGEAPGTTIGQNVIGSNNTMINGKMNYDCNLLLNETINHVDHSCTPNAGLSKFQFTAGKTHRLHLVNSGAEGIIRFSIDEHNLTVIAEDFVSVVPYQTNIVQLGVGQRYDVLVNANNTGAFWMRATVPDTPGSSFHCSRDYQPIALAAVYYDGTDTNISPRSDPYLNEDLTDCGIDDTPSPAIPSFSRTPVPAATTRVISVGVAPNATCSKLFNMDGSSFIGDYNDPVLPLAAAGNFSLPREWNTYNFGTNSSVLIYLNNTSNTAHPMHLHGHNFWVIASGRGEWDGLVHAANTLNPPRRDVVMLPTANIDANGVLIEPGYNIILYEQNNPGVWPMHCHIAWHVSGGLYANFVEQPQAIAATGDLPTIFEETCGPWNDWTNSHFVDQIDSGE